MDSYNVEPLVGSGGGATVPDDFHAGSKEGSEEIIDEIKSSPTNLFEESKKKSGMNKETHPSKFYRKDILEDLNYLDEDVCLEAKVEERKTMRKGENNQSSPFDPFFSTTGTLE